MIRSLKSKAYLVILLTISLLATGCSASWITVALADLPVLIQMALNIGTLATTIQSGNQLSEAESAAIHNLSAQVSEDLNLLQTLYNQYKDNPNPATIQKIQSAISEINQNLPAILQAMHIRDAVLSARITAAVNLTLTTVNSFAALIPQNPATGSMVGSAHQARQRIIIPQPADLRNQWNLQVCAPASGNAEFAAACPMR